MFQKKSLKTYKLAQTSIALINLTYNLNDGTDWKGVYTRNGTANAANLDCYFRSPDDNKCPISQQLVQGLANSYGASSPILLKRGTYDQIQDVVKSTDNYGYFCRNTSGECAYRFVEYNRNDQERKYPLFTNRTITASAGQCFTYWETEEATPAKDASGIPDALNFTIFNGSDHDSIIIPEQLSGVDATTYIYRGTAPPPNATLFACGDRCIWMWAHKNAGHNETSTFYKCPITVRPVININKPSQIVPNSVARLAASAIALQGRWAVKNNSEGLIWTQFQYYPFG